MKTTPELVAKLIFASSQLRYFEKEMLMTPENSELRLELQDIVIKWQHKIDDVLDDMGMTEFIPLKQLIEMVQS